MNRIRAAVLALLTALGVGAGVAVAGPAHAVTYSCGAITQVSWGAVQVCRGVDDPSSYRIAALDKVTDGYCVEARYYSSDASAYRNYPDPRARSCTTGGWKTVVHTNYSCNGVRLYRDDGTYFTAALPPNC